ncbi:hypothetical protein E4T42_05823 [Aureobasidium subglaciale]|nr:hypothetical protein E4T42_05823 [Aureobasidium subglaciale]
MPPTKPTPCGFSPHNESTIFNNVKDFDIIVRFSKQKIHAHRIILRVASPFFDQVFNSKLPGPWKVAQKDTHDLGDEDDVDAVWAMFRHMYNIDYCYDPTSTETRSLEFHIAVFTTADKYDCPGLREKAVDRFGQMADTELKAGKLDRFIALISKICGSDSPQMADHALRDKVAELCLTHFNVLISSDLFARTMVQGYIFDERAAHKLLIYAIGRHVHPHLERTRGTLPDAARTFKIAAEKLVSSS